ncbi:hypothetical protein CLV30_11780 [Haloactinopolyspora alba]|uniref:Uncharacterized protein n=1 Tax=Haloactinopolyspora alba TaxID=648780 RepID=A0A2P8DRD7_9ACTN|nr:hypothetical protein CLV30_11780 [Haloactinopolyspora alba]
MADVAVVIMRCQGRLVRDKPAASPCRLYYVNGAGRYGAGRAVATSVDGLPQGPVASVMVRGGRELCSMLSR